MPRGEFDRSERRARTRAALLEAAGRVYARRGFDGATLDEIAEEAGFTKGAVYDHFGSKEKLLFALLDEHLGNQIAEQVALFDPARAPADRPRAGSDRWMAELEEDPDVFRLFVEAWVHGQRDEEFRARVAAGMQEWRSTFQSFGRQRTQELAAVAPDDVLEQSSTVMVALGIGLAMIKLAEPGLVPPGLLGAASSILLGALEADPRAGALLAELASRRA
jgi:AcrR family transcriptional regulator